MSDTAIQLNLVKTASYQPKTTGLSAEFVDIFPRLQPKEVKDGLVYQEFGVPVTWNSQAGIMLNNNGEVIAVLKWTNNTNAGNFEGLPRILDSHKLENGDFACLAVSYKLERPMKLEAFSRSESKVSKDVVDKAREVISAQKVVHNVSWF